MGDLPAVALSVQQPFAWAIVNGWKPVENRDWPTQFRGDVLIHAGKKFDAEGYDWILRRGLVPEDILPAPAAFERGGIVGVSRIFECVTRMGNPWFVGRYGFHFDRAYSRPLPFFACRGQLGFFRVEYPAEVARG